VASDRKLHRHHRSSDAPKLNAPRIGTCTLQPIPRLASNLRHREAPRPTCVTRSTASVKGTRALSRPRAASLAHSTPASPFTPPSTPTAPIHIPAMASRTRQYLNSIYSSLKYTASFAVWIPVVILFTDNVYSLERVTGRSMSPNFCPDPTRKDYIIARHWNATKELRRGEVVMFRYAFDFHRRPLSAIDGLRRAENYQLTSHHPDPLQTLPDKS
jgi:hypothetical protein